MLQELSNYNTRSPVRTNLLKSEDGWISRINEITLGCHETQLSAIEGFPGESLRSYIIYVRSPLWFAKSTTERALNSNSVASTILLRWRIQGFLLGNSDCQLSRASQVKAFVDIVQYVDTCGTRQSIQVCATSDVLLSCGPTDIKFPRFVVRFWRFISE